MEQPILMHAQGTNGTLQLLPDRIRILRQNWLAPIYERDSQVELMLLQIRSMELKTTFGGLGGYLAFHDNSGLESFEHLCVSFVWSQQSAFVAIQDAIERQRQSLLAQQAQDFQVFASDTTIFA